MEVGEWGGWGAVSQVGQYVKQAFLQLGNSYMAFEI